MTDYLLLTLSIILLLSGIIGCLLPVIPGPPLSFAGLLLLHFSRFAEFSKTILLVLGIVVLVVTILDYLVPIWGTRFFGGSKYGTRGATIGLIVGLFIGPAGIVLGPLIGAFVGELIYKDDMNYALKAGLGSLLGFLSGVGLKLGASFVITFYFIKGLF